MKPMMWRRASLVLAFGLLLVALTISTMTAYSQDLTAGKGLFEGYCGPCHGLQGQGQLAIPNIAGTAGHVEQLGIPISPDGPNPLVELLRAGIPNNMPYFPPEVLSDEEIMDLGAYLFSLPPTTGENIYAAACALCHGARGVGYIGPPLNTTVDFLTQTGLTRDQAVPELAGLVRGGIPGQMPAIPYLTDLEIGRLLDYLLELSPSRASDPQWEAAFQAQQGRMPTDLDRIDRDWSIQFAERNGRSPSDVDWIAHWLSMQPPPGEPAGGPPPGP